MIIQNRTYGRLHIRRCDYHRNGVFGAGYYALRLSWRCDGKQVKATAIIFDADEHAAILDDEGQSWRYEEFAADLRKFADSPAGQCMAFPYLADTMVGA